MKKHIIISLGDYYPTPSANGICIDSIVNELINEGFVVDIVCNRINKVSGTIKEGNKSLYFIDLPLIEKLNDYSKGRNGVLFFAIRIILKLLVLLRVPCLYFLFPVTSLFRCVQYKRVIDDVVDNNNVVAIIGVHKPIEAMYGACLSAKKNRIPFFSYFLDPLVNGYKKIKVMGSRRISKNTKEYEKKILRYSVKAIYMESHRRDVESRYSMVDKGKFEFLGPPLLKKYEHQENTSSSNGKKKVIFGGSVYKDIRDPQYIIEVFKYTKNAKLDMYIPSPHEWIDFNNNPNVTVHGGVSHNEMLVMMMDADALLNIGNSSAVFIPSKIIEYLGLTKPIICTYRIDEDPCLPYMEKYEASICIDERNEGIEDAARRIDEFLERSHKDISFKQIESDYYINTPKAFADVVKSSLKE